jgi:hypothetical protein
MNQIYDMFMLRCKHDNIGTIQFTFSKYIIIVACRFNKVGFCHVCADSMVTLVVTICCFMFWQLLWVRCVCVCTCVQQCVCVHMFTILEMCLARKQNTMHDLSQPIKPIC